jgi:hypothetical protein
MVLGKVVAEEARLVGCRQQLQAVLIELGSLCKSHWPVVVI